MIAIGQFFFRFRNAIFPAVMLIALVLVEPEYSFGSLRSDWLVDLLGPGPDTHGADAAGRHHRL